MIGVLGVVGRVGVGADLERADARRPAHERVVGFGQLGLLQRQLAGEDFAGRAVEGEELALLDGLAADAHCLGLVIDVQRFAADDAALAPAAGDDGRVARSCRRWR